MWSEHVGNFMNIVSLVTALSAGDPAWSACLCLPEHGEFVTALFVGDTVWSACLCLPNSPVSYESVLKGVAIPVGL